jgi:hypothetical protein
MISSKVKDTPDTRKGYHYISVGDDAQHVVIPLAGIRITGSGSPDQTSRDQAW